MGIVKSTYAEIVKQSLEQNPYFCLESSHIDINPHQVEAFTFALSSLPDGGCILADEVGLGKTIEAGLVLKYLLASGNKKILLIMPSNLRKQWQLELEDKFDISSNIIDSSNIDEYDRSIKKSQSVIIVSYNFAAKQKNMLANVAWDYCVFDEAHRLRNVYKNGAKTANAIFDYTKSIPKIMLTATPMQNTLLDLYGIVSFIDDKIFYSKSVFSERYVRGEMFTNLKEQLAPVVQRTLRSEVSDYIHFSKRREITVDFALTPNELELYMRITEYLQKQVIYALPNSRRALITSVIRKLLASSSMAVAETFEVLKKRLLLLKESTRQETADESLDYFLNFVDDEDYDEHEEEYAEELYPRERVNDFIQHEIDEVDAIINNAKSIKYNAKLNALKQALVIAFDTQKQAGISQKAVIFTESVRTQSYIKEELSNSGYNDEILMFNGMMNDRTTKEIYKAWQSKNYGKPIGSRSVEIKNAVVEAFKDDYKILLVTDSGSEGLNLQFCNTVINYDLPWNPQKIEQRIGRCHRYGQANDVVVINLLNTQNEADKRVYEILAKKFELFQGVFGASDKAIGLLESGNGFEKRISQIYQECKTTAEFNREFNSLERELDRKRNTKTKELRNIISKMSEKEHKIVFKKILEDISDYDEKTSYWGIVPCNKNILYPKTLRVRNGFHVKTIKQGVLLIGGYYQGNCIISPIFQIMDMNGTFQDLTESEIRTVLDALTDECIEEEQQSKCNVLNSIDKLNDRLYEYYRSINQSAIDNNNRKIENWMNLRKEALILDSKDTSVIEDLETKYQEEDNFKIKVQLKKEIEAQQKKQQDLQQTFHTKMSEIECEAHKMEDDYKTSIMKSPQLVIKMVVEF